MVAQLRIAVRERGPTPRGFKKIYRAVAKFAWLESAKFFHREFTDARFTEEHARKAKYSLRSGQLLPRTSKAFRNSYYGRKYVHPRLGGGPNKALPFVYSGQMRKDVQRESVSSTSNGAKVKYPGAAPANYTRRGQEFARLIPEEVTAVAAHFDEHLDRFLDQS